MALDWLAYLFLYTEETYEEKTAIMSARESKLIKNYTLPQVLVEDGLTHVDQWHLA